MWFKLKRRKKYDFDNFNYYQRVSNIGTCRGFICAKAKRQQQHGFICAKAKRQQQHGFICAKAKRQQQHGFICAKAKRQQQHTIE